MFSFSWTPLLIGLVFLMGLVLTVILGALKLLGYLLLSWWWIAAPVPVLLLIVIIVAGLIALSGK